MRLDCFSGIYKILNTTTGEVYIGQSKNITRRWHEHIKKLRSGMHHNYRLQEAYEKFGITCFTFEILKLCEVSDLDFEELAYICEYDSINSGYNILGKSETYDIDCATGVRGKFVVDIDGLIKTGISPSSLFRYLNIYVRIATTDGEIGKPFGIKRVVDLQKYTNMCDTMFRMFKKEMSELNLITISKSGDIVLDNRYIYKLKEWKLGIPKESIIIYKDSIVSMYEQSTLHEHKILGSIFYISEILCKNKCEYNHVINQLNHIYENPRRCIGKWQNILIEGLPAFKYYNGDCMVNTSLFHKPDILGRKNDIDCLFSDMQNNIIKK